MIQFFSPHFSSSSSFTTNKLLDSIIFNPCWKLKVLSSFSKASGGEGVHDVLDEKKCEENPHKLPDSSSANFRRLDAKPSFTASLKYFLRSWGDLIRKWNFKHSHQHTFEPLKLSSSIKGQTEGRNWHIYSEGLRGWLNRVVTSIK